MYVFHNLADDRISLRKDETKIDTLLKELSENFDKVCNYSKVIFIVSIGAIQFEFKPIQTSMTSYNGEIIISAIGKSW